MKNKILKATFILTLIVAVSIWGCGNLGGGCVVCDGKGETDCVLCNNGISDCAICVNGSTEFGSCTFCNGRGESECTFCNGKEKTKCTFCNGTGKSQ